MDDGCNFALESTMANIGVEPSRQTVLCDHVAEARGSSRTLDRQQELGSASDLRRNKARP
jgi:hypothetical protein